jgi:hypothetical protein
VLHDELFSGLTGSCLVDSLRFPLQNSKIKKIVRFVKVFHRAFPLIQRASACYENSGERSDAGSVPPEGGEFFPLTLNFLDPAGRHGRKRQLFETV